MSCAPSKGNKTLSCYSLQSLQNIAKAYNKHYGKKISIAGRSKTQLWKDIRDALSNRCGDSEYCWMKEVPAETKTPEIKYDTFRPTMPKEWKKTALTTWLNTDDINSVMKQYEYKYPDFFFVGPVPIDCNIGSKLSCQLTKFNVNKLLQHGIHKIAVIYNTDTSTGPGQHWQALTCTIPKAKGKAPGKITFFDSFGAKPSHQIMFLMRRLQTDLKQGSNVDMDIEWNKKQHQTDSYNCGMYSMYFIVKTLEGKTLKQINAMDLSHDKMQKLKKEYYRA
jgi:Ulp1 protease family, C-terminal catalytic domain